MQQFEAQIWFRIKNEPSRQQDSLKVAQGTRPGPHMNRLKWFCELFRFREYIWYRYRSSKFAIEKVRQPSKYVFYVASSKGAQVEFFSSKKGAKISWHSPFNTAYPTLFLRSGSVLVEKEFSTCHHHVKDQGDEKNNSGRIYHIWPHRKIQILINSKKRC